MPARPSATYVAQRAGHSVEVLLKIYAKCLDGDDGIMNGRIDGPAPYSGLAKQTKIQSANGP